MIEKICEGVYFDLGDLVGVDVSFNDFGKDPNLDYQANFRVESKKSDTGICYESLPFKDLKKLEKIIDSILLRKNTGRVE